MRAFSVCVLLLAFTTIAQADLGGKWVVRDAQTEVVAEFRADGTFTRSTRSAQTSHELARDAGYLTGDCYPCKGTDGNRCNLPTDKYHFIMNKDGDILSQDSHVPPSSDWTSIEPYNQ